MKGQKKSTTAQATEASRPADDSQANPPDGLGTVPSIESILNAQLGSDEPGQQPAQPGEPEKGESQEAVTEPESPQPKDEPKPKSEAETEQDSGTEESQEQSESDGDEESGEDDDGDEDASDEESRKYSARIQRRIDRLTKRYRATQNDLTRERERARELEARLEQNGTQPQMSPAPAGQAGLENVTAPQLDTIESQATRLHSDLDDYVDGMATDAQRKSVESYAETQGLDEVGLKRRRRDLQRLIEREIPRRREFIAREAALEPRAVELFPFWKDRSSEDYQTAMQVVQTMPEIKRLPHWKIVAGTYLLGLKQLKAGLQESKSLPTKAPTAPPPKQPTRPSAPPARVPKPDVQRSALKDRAVKSANDNDVAAYFEHELATGRL
jgi:hypothetical protein